MRPRCTVHVLQASTIMTDENMAQSALTDGPNSRITHPSTTSSGYRPDRVNMSTAIDLTASEERMYTDSEPNIAASEASPKVTQADEHPGGWDAPKPLEKQVQSSPHQDCQQQSDSIALLPRHSHDALRSGPLEQGGSRNHDQLNPPESHDMALLSSNESSHAPGYSDLFFDLLFAACLNTYSNAVSLERFSNVAAFLGYFTAIWWAWWSQAYFDVRYRRTMRHQPMPASHPCSCAGSVGRFLDHTFRVFAQQLHQFHLDLWILPHGIGARSRGGPPV